MYKNYNSKHIILKLTLKVVLNHCFKLNGKVLSIVLTSPDKRDIIRPDGVVSKNCIGALRVLWMTKLCNSNAARIDPMAKKIAARITETANNKRWKYYRILVLFHRIFCKRINYLGGTFPFMFLFKKNFNIKHFHFYVYN